MSGRSLGTNLHSAMVTPMMPHHFHGFRLLPSRARPVTLGQFLTRELRKQVMGCSGRSDHAIPNEGLVHELLFFVRNAVVLRAHISFDISGTKSYVLDVRQLKVI